jgi:hypothetical protein
MNKFWKPAVKFRQLETAQVRCSDTDMLPWRKPVKSLHVCECWNMVETRRYSIKT